MISEIKSHAISCDLAFANLLQPSAVFDSLPFPRDRSQVPDGLESPELRKVFHYVDVAAGMKLAAEGNAAHAVPFKHHGVKMTLYKGEAALKARR